MNSFSVSAKVPDAMAEEEKKVKKSPDDGLG